MLLENVVPLMSAKIRIHLPFKHPHLSQSFQLIYPKHIQLQSNLYEEQCSVSAFVIGVADINDFISIDESGLLYLGMQEYASQFAQHGVVLFIDAASEGWPFVEPAFQRFHEILKKFNISSNAVVLLTTNYLFDKDYKGWCDLSGLDPIFVHTYDFWCYKSSIQLRQEISVGDADIEILLSNEFDIEKHFICLNRVFKAHRAAIPMFLMKINLMENSLVSFMPDSKSLTEADKAQMLDYMLGMGWPTLTELCSQWPHLAALVPKVVDLDGTTDYLTFVINKISSKNYRRVGLAIITESDFGVHGVDRVTEKPFKAIANCCPFLLVGQPHQLSRLEKLGFVRHPLINNSYDRIVSANERLSSVLAELMRLGKMSNSKLSEFRTESHSVSVVNFKHLLNFSSDDSLERLAVSLISSALESKVNYNSI